MERKENIPFVKPFVPPADDLLPYYSQISNSGILSNKGVIHNEFEEALSRYLGVSHISLFSSGTLALTLALKAMKLKGEVITTPFTSPATLQAIHWNNLAPVFTDIRNNDFNIDPGMIESAITTKTCAILPAHIFGLPCDVVEIDQLSKNYDIPVIYDAAHCFGEEINGTSLCNFGDLSVLSFHATKVFNTLEGGAVICKDEIMKRYIDILKNTGINENGNLEGYGMNAKMNELQAAYGLCHLKYMDKIMEMRTTAAHEYFSMLKDIPGLRYQDQKPGIKYNFPYMPVIIDQEAFGADRDMLESHLANRGIHTKKYFYPLVSDFKEFSPYKTVEMPVAERVSQNIICLPLFHDISLDQIQYVVESIRELQSHTKSGIHTDGVLEPSPSVS